MSSVSSGSATGEGEPAAYPEPGNLVPGTSGVYVYATPDGDYYHLTESDAGSGARGVPRLKSRPTASDSLSM